MKKSIFICQRVKDSYRCQLFSISFDNKSGFNKCGLWYAPINIESVPLPETYDRGSINEMACDYAILCPCISSVPELKCYYTSFSKKWQYRTKSSSSTYPMMSNNFILSLIDENTTNSYDAFSSFKF